MAGMLNNNFVERIPESREKYCMATASSSSRHEGTMSLTFKLCERSGTEAEVQLSKRGEAIGKCIKRLINIEAWRAHLKRAINLNN